MNDKHPPKGDLCFYGSCKDAYKTAIRLVEQANEHNCPVWSAQVGLAMYQVSRVLLSTWSSAAVEEGIARTKDGGPYNEEAHYKTLNDAMVKAGLDPNIKSAIADAIMRMVYPA